MPTKAVSLKVKPELDAASAKRMDNQMNQRFVKVANKYGDEMQKQNQKITDNFEREFTKTTGRLRKGWALAAGAIAAVAGALMKNPIDEANATLDAYLARMDNIATRAQQWNIDPGKYAIASGVADVANVDPAMFDNMLFRIADRIEKARTGEDIYLKEFVGADDAIDAAFQLFQTWRNMAPEERARSMSEVLGNRQANVFAELVDTDWIDEARRIMGEQSTQQISQYVQAGGDLERIQRRNRVQLQFDEMGRLGPGIDQNTLAWQKELEGVRQREKLDDVINYQQFAQSEIGKINAMAQSVDEIADRVNKIWGQLADRWGINGEEGKTRAAERHNAKWSALQQQAAEDVPDLNPFSKRNRAARRQMLGGE